MDAKAARRVQTNLWTARVMPVLVLAMLGYVTYVVVKQLCANYLLRGPGRDEAAAVIILIVYFTTFLPMAASYLRLLTVTVFNPPYVPRPSTVAAKGRISSTSRQTHSDGLVTSEYVADEKALGGSDADILREGADSHGLDLFRTKDVFVCAGDGKPIWCSQCSNWKPDRAHHDSASGRCIMKMDHFCPWVGGAVGENNFKFFIQFNGYAAVYCLYLLIIMAVYIHRQIIEERHVNAQLAVVLGLAAFFGSFTASMFGVSTNMARRNLTSVEKLGELKKTFFLAVHNPHNIISDIDPRSSDGVYPSSQEDTRVDKNFMVINAKEVGNNPWDLGSARLNLQSIMGTSIGDWLLPIRYSPCCNHESADSYYELGPRAKELQAKIKQSGAI